MKSRDLPGDSESRNRSSGVGVNDAFRRFAHRASCFVGCPAAFATAFLILLLWAIAGPFFKFSDTWQLVINTATTIVTFLMVFLIQNTQNRDAQAIHLKLDELIHALQGARNGFIRVETLSDDQLLELQRQFERMRRISNLPGESGSKRDQHAA